MGQKVNPIGFRVGTFLPWKSRWFSDDAHYKDYLLEDITVRKALMERLKLGGITRVEIERLPKSIQITLVVSRPGVVIGRGGTGLEDLKKFILEILRQVRGKKITDVKVDLQVNEVKTMERVMQSGALGVKVVLAGRIGGAEISRREKFHQGSVPTQTLRENIDYAQVPALLKRGYVGVKVYIHKKPEEE